MKIKAGIVFLVILILFNIGDFFDILPGDIDFVEKLFGIVGFAILFYMANLTDIFFGSKHKMMDGWILVACFSLMMKDFIAYMETSIDVGNFLIPGTYQMFVFIQQNSHLIEQISFYFGVAMLFLVAIVCAIDVPIRKPSIMHMLHEDFPPTNLRRILLRFLSIYLILLSFFIIVFNLAIQWLTVALDAPQLMLLILSYAILLIWHRSTLKTERLIHKLGELGIDFYKKFINLFHYKKTFFYGVSGLLVLHVIQEIGVFMTSYIAGIFDPLYMGRLKFGTLGHKALYTIIGTDLASTSNIVQKISIVWIYFFNVLAIIILLTIPIFAWYTLFKKKELHIPQIFLAFIYTALFIFLVMPCFGLFQLRGEQETAISLDESLETQLEQEQVLGVDILTKSILEDNFATVFLGEIPIPPVITVTLLSLIIFLMVLIGEIKRDLRKTFYVASIFYGLAFFGYYLFLFGKDLITYYWDSIVTYFEIGNYVFVTYFGIFLVITALFYISGYFIFIWEVYSEHMYEKWSKEVE